MKSIYKIMFLTLLAFPFLSNCSSTKKNNVYLTSLEIIHETNINYFYVGSIFKIPGLVVEAKWSDDSLTYPSYGDGGFSTSKKVGSLFNLTDVGEQKIKINYLDKSCDFTVTIFDNKECSYSSFIEIYSLYYSNYLETDISQRPNKAIITSSNGDKQIHIERTINYENNVGKIYSFIHGEGDFVVSGITPDEIIYLIGTLKNEYSIEYYRSDDIIYFRANKISGSTSASEIIYTFNRLAYVNYIIDERISPYYKFVELISKDATVDKIEVFDTVSKDSYVVGESFNVFGLIIIAYWSDGTITNPYYDKEDGFITTIEDGYVFQNQDISDSLTVGVTYKGKETFFTISVRGSRVITYDEFINLYERVYDEYINSTKERYKKVQVSGLCASLEFEENCEISYGEDNLGFINPNGLKQKFFVTVKTKEEFIEKYETFKDVYNFSFRYDNSEQITLFFSMSDKKGATLESETLTNKGYVTSLFNQLIGGKIFYFVFDNYAL